jgi:hypothetical protein
VASLSYFYQTVVSSGARIIRSRVILRSQETCFPHPRGTAGPSTALSSASRRTELRMTAVGDVGTLQEQLPPSATRSLHNAGFSIAPVQSSSIRFGTRPKSWVLFGRSRGAEETCCPSQRTAGSSIPCFPPLHEEENFARNDTERTSLYYARLNGCCSCGASARRFMRHLRRDTSVLSALPTHSAASMQTAGANQ